MLTLAEQFARVQGQPIDVDGHSVQMLFKKKASADLTMRIRWVRRVDAPVQGVSVSVKGGALRVGSSKVKDVVLWADTAPDEVTLQCDGRDVRELSLWNCWRDERDVTHAWVGNSGMIVEETGPGAYRFRCNSRPEITFDDLVFDVEFEEQT